MKLLENRLVRRILRSDRQRNWKMENIEKS
jgi:hypothetical protein